MANKLGRFYYWSFGRITSKSAFIAVVRRLTGRTPGNILLYKQALRHSSVVENPHESNERLELLGDSVLDLIAAEYLFFKFPYKEEGFLTEMRAKLVNRKQLNLIGKSMELDSFVESNLDKHALINSSALGNAFEALVGAVYLDQGFKATQQFIIHKVFDLHLDIDKLLAEETNFKSVIIQYAQRFQIQYEFLTIENESKKQDAQFKCDLHVASEIMGTGFGRSKKTAEQAAAHQAYLKLQKSGKIEV